MKNLNLERKEINSKGITLVALIVTIIVLLILAGVTIITLTGDNGLLTKSKSAVDKYSEGEIEEKIKLAYQEWQMAQFTGTTENANDFIKDRLDNAIGNVEDVSVDGNALTVTINKNNEEKTYYYNIAKGLLKQITLAKNSSNKNESYVGCYADIDEDGIVDGVIFADLLTGSVRDTQKWRNNNGVYNLPTNVTLSNVSTYYISQEIYADSKFGTHAVISPKTINGENRFYIMQLSDFTTPAYTDENDETKNYPAYISYYWYKNANSHMSPLITSNGFGTGRENTGKMITKWNAAGTTDGYTDSAQEKQDIWKHIQTKYNEGWFIPSRAEWAAFANEIGGENPITTSNYRTYGLSTSYWSSSQADASYNWNIGFNDYIGYCRVDGTLSVRLATTF